MNNTFKNKRLKRNEACQYLIVGGGTTLINIVILFSLTHIEVPWILANMIAWFSSILFAFIANKIIFSDSTMTTPKAVVKEGLSFFALRGVSLLINALILFTTGLTLMHGSHLTMSLSSSLKPVINS